MAPIHPFVGSFAFGSLLMLAAVTIRRSGHFIEPAAGKAFTDQLRARRGLQAAFVNSPLAYSAPDTNANYVDEVHCYGGACNTFAQWESDPVHEYYPDPTPSSKYTFRLDLYNHINGDKKPIGITFYESLYWGADPFAYIPVKVAPVANVVPPIAPSSSGPLSSGAGVGPPPVGSSSAATGPIDSGSAAALDPAGAGTGPVPFVGGPVSGAGPFMDTAGGVGVMVGGPPPPGGRPPMGQP